MNEEGRSTCPSCEQPGMTWREAIQVFDYAGQAGLVELTATVQVGHCAACGEEFTDWRAEDGLAAAVARHLATLRADGAEAVGSKKP